MWLLGEASCEWVLLLRCLAHIHASTHHVLLASHLVEWIVSWHLIGHELVLLLLLLLHEWVEALCLHLLLLHLLHHGGLILVLHSLGHHLSHHVLLCLLLMGLEPSGIGYEPITLNKVRWTRSVTYFGFCGCSGWAWSGAGTWMLSKPNGSALFYGCYCGYEIPSTKYCSWLFCWLFRLSNSKTST